LPLLLPSKQDYQSASEQIINWIQWLPEKVDWCIYGSFVTWKVRPWLSDIDTFLLVQDTTILFPWNISTVFSETKNNIEGLGIPLQVTYATTWALESRFASPDYFYLQEVKRGIEMWYSSVDFSDKFIENRTWSIDDLWMARYFLKKVSNLPANLHKIPEIISKSKADITLEDQRDLQRFWDTFKKMFSFCTLSVRILRWDSVFDKPDDEIFDMFHNEVWNIPDLDSFLQILWDIKSIEDWYKYLKEENGLEKILNIYNTVFQDIAKKVSERFNDLYSNV